MYKSRTIFPFTLFPTDIAITNRKVIITYRPFFFTKRVITILYEDLVNAWSTMIPFFSSVEFELRFQEQNPPRITFLPRKAGQKIVEVITKHLQKNKSNSSDVAFEKGYLKPRQIANLNLAQ